YKTKSTEKLVNDFLGDLEQSHEIVPEEFAKRPLRVRLFESTARLFRHYYKDCIFPLFIRGFFIFLKKTSVKSYFHTIKAHFAYSLSYR
ncbi:hypothetical protein QDK53_43475, partial [Amycolatopsis magusensis]|nr:hypothetical protein [Amycolatopsis magusensis]